MAEEHISSYYAATANDATRYPALDGSTRADVCIVGAGYSGIATALNMVERGRSVVVVEQNRVGWGSSGRNGGQMIAGMSGEANLKRQLGAAGARLLRDLRYRGHEIIEGRIRQFGIACDLAHGWMEAAARPRHMTALREYHDELVRDGFSDSVELVEPEAMRDVAGTGVYHGGLIDLKSGHLHPLNLIKGEARGATSLGVRIFEDTEALEIAGGAKPYVRTARGRIDAGTVVLAGDTGHKFRQGRLNGLMLPTGSYIIATEPIEPGLAARLSPRNLAVADSNVVLDYFRMSADRRMLFGGRCNYTNRDPKDLVAAMRPRLVEIFPELSDVRIEFAWGGRIGIVLTRIPAIGRLEPNLYYLQGYCGHGLNATHIAAEIVSDAICGTTEKFDLFDRIRHIPLPIGQWAGNQVLALGMLYYRLKDLL